MKTICLFSVMFIFLFPVISIGQITWKPYANNVSFKIKNAGFTVSGSFDSVTTTLVFSPDKLSAGSLSGMVKGNSIHTGINKRDEHLKKEEFFNIDKFPDIEIKSVKLYNKDAWYAGLFDVTIKGVTKQMEIPFEFIPIADEGEFKGTFTIDRKDFGIGGSSMMMSDNVTVDIDIKAKK